MPFEFAFEYPINSPDMYFKQRSFNLHILYVNFCIFLLFLGNYFRQIKNKLLQRYWKKQMIDLTYYLVPKYIVLLMLYFFFRDTPLDEGGRSDTQYRVECPLCSAAVVVTPKSPSSQTSVTVSNLQPGATYKIRVLALNGVSGLSVANDNYAEIQAFSNADSQSAVVGDLR